MDTKEIRLKEKEIVGWFGDTYQDTYVNIIDIFAMCFKRMSKEQKYSLLQGLGMEKDITQAVIDRLSGKETGFSESFDDDMRLEALRSIEKYTVETLDWNLLHKTIRDIQEKLKQLNNNDSIYMKMYHDEKNEEFFRVRMRENNIKSHYSNKYSEIKEYVKGKMDDLFDKKG